MAPFLLMQQDTAILIMIFMTSETEQLSVKVEVGLIFMQDLLNIIGSEWWHVTHHAAIFPGCTL